MQRSRNAVINWLSRVTTPRCGRKKRACERVSERAGERASEHLTSIRDPAASSAILDQAILTSALRETALFALVICAGCDLSSVFSKLSSGQRAPNESFVPFYCSAARIARFRIISAITVWFRFCRN